MSAKSSRDEAVETAPGEKASSTIGFTDDDASALSSTSDSELVSDDPRPSSDLRRYWRRFELHKDIESILLQHKRLI
jgi:hypothetical protein